MKGFVEGVDRRQSTLLPEYLEDWIDEDNRVRVVDVFIDELDLWELGFVSRVSVSSGYTKAGRKRHWAISSAGRTGSVCAGSISGQRYCRTA